MLHEFDVRDDCTNTAQIGVEFYSIEEWNRIEHAAKQYWPRNFFFLFFVNLHRRESAREKTWPVARGRFSYGNWNLSFLKLKWQKKKNPRRVHWAKDSLLMIPKMFLNLLLTPPILPLARYIFFLFNYYFTPIIYLFLVNYTSLFS